MKKRVPKIICAIALTILIGCNKNDDVEVNIDSVPDKTVTDEPTEVEVNNRLSSFGRDNTNNAITYNDNGNGKVQSYQLTLGNKKSSYSIEYGNNEFVEKVFTSTDVLGAYIYDNAGRMNSAEERNGGAATLLYNTKGLLDSLYIVGHITTLTNTTYETDLFRKYVYDETNRLVEVREKVSSGDGYSYTRDLLSYDGKGNLVQIINQGGGLYGDNYSDENKITLEYDEEKNPYFDILKGVGVSNRWSLLYIPGFYTTYLGNSVLHRLHYVSPNNLTKYKWIYYDSQDNNRAKVAMEYDISYEFNEIGYPISAIQDYAAANGQAVDYNINLHWAYETY